LGTRRRKTKQKHRETGSTGYKTKKNKTKTQRNWQHRVQDEEKQNKNTEKLSGFRVVMSGAVSA
jgi:hypothetical protein